MCVPTRVREPEGWVKSHCYVCKGRKSPKRTSWNCSACDRRASAAGRKVDKLWAAKRKAA